MNINEHCLLWSKTIYTGRLLIIYIYKVGFSPKIKFILEQIITIIIEH